MHLQTLTMGCILLGLVLAIAPSVLGGCPHMDSLLMWNDTAAWNSGQVSILRMAQLDNQLF